MRRIIFIAVITSLLLAGCYSSPYVDSVRKKDGQKVVIIKDGTSGNTESGQKYKAQADSIKQIVPGEMGFYTEDGSRVIVMANGNSAWNVMKQDLSGNWQAILKNQEGKYFKVSPDRKKILFVNSSSSTVICEISDGTTRAFNPGEDLVNQNTNSNYVLDYSMSWGDENSITYSDRNGSIYVRDYITGNIKSFKLDSPFKTDICLIDGKVVYLKRLGLWIDTMGITGMQSQDRSNQLVFSARDNMVDQIIEPKESLNITSYRISPDKKKIALYFETDENEGILFTADIEKKLFTQNIRYEKLLHVFNGKVIDFQWNPNSDTLVYSTDGQGCGLYIANSDGSSSGCLISGKLFSNVQWNMEGNSISTVENNAKGNMIYEIRLKESTD